MMDITDFLLSACASILGNKLTPKDNPPKPGPTSVDKTTLLDESAPQKKLAIRPLVDRSSWAKFGELFRNLVSAIGKTNIFLFIESEPSTYYNLVTVIVEDTRTGDWYPFEQNVVFEGSGSGWHTAQQLGWEIQKAQEQGADVRVSIRVAYNNDLADLMSGVSTWSDVKNRSIPALISAESHYWVLQERFTKEVLNDTKSDKT
jgi:hypothetical protein